MQPESKKGGIAASNKLCIKNKDEVVAFVETERDMMAGVVW